MTRAVSGGQHVRQHQQILYVLLIHLVDNIVILCDIVCVVDVTYYCIFLHNSEVKIDTHTVYLAYFFRSQGLSFRFCS